MRTRTNVRKILSITLLFCFVATMAPPAVAEQQATAELSEVQGQVFKRLFDLLSFVLGSPIKASLKDKLTDGSQVGTGSNSWSEISWPEVVTRQWANTVVKVLPGKRTVFLANGDMLFRLKKEGTSSDYNVWTKVLQARIRGTTVLFQRTSEVTRVCVVEGRISVKNLIDGSEVSLGPGAVYEVLTPGGQGKPENDEMPWASPTEPPERMPPISLDESDPKWQADRKNAVLPAHEICQTDIPPVHMFGTPQSSTSIWVEDRTAVLNHPLIREFQQPLDSYPLIKSTTDDLPDICFEDKKKNSTNPLADRNKLLGGVVEVAFGPPSDKRIEIGKELGYRFSMPTPVAAGAQPEKIKVPSNVIRTGYVKPTYTKSTGQQDLNDLEKQYSDACRKAEDFKNSTIREKNQRMDRMKQECSSLTPDECQSRKNALENWEREQRQKCDQLHGTANSIKAQIDQLRARQFR